MTARFVVRKGMVKMVVVVVVFVVLLNACIAMAFLQDNEGYDEGLDDDPALEA